MKVIHIERTVNTEFQPVVNVTVQITPETFEDLSGVEPLHQEYAREIAEQLYTAIKAC